MRFRCIRFRPFRGAPIPIKNNYMKKLFPLLTLAAVATGTAAAGSFVPMKMRAPGAPSSERNEPQKTAENIPALNGIVVYASHWGGDAKAGLYALPTGSEPDFRMLVPEAYGSGIVIGNRLYTVARITMPELEIDYPRLTVYDMDSGDEIYFENFYSPDWSVVPVDMDIDPVSGSVYAITYNRDMTGYQLSTLAFTDSSVTSTKIADMEGNWNAIAFDAAGQLYGISKINRQEDGQLVCAESALNKIDRETGAVTLIGETGMKPEYASSATIDKASGRMFWSLAPADDTGFLAEVDLTTGAATEVYRFAHSEEVVGLYAPLAETASSAPAKVTDLAADFPQGALAGKVTFTAPTTLYDGSAASGTMTYRVTLNEETAAEGSVAAGEPVEAAVTASARGQYKIGVTVSNTAGDSPVAAVNLFIGNGTPDAPFYAAAQYNADLGQVLLRWDPVTTSADGGYIDPAQVRYTVIRYPGAETVGTGIADSFYAYDVAEPDGFEVCKYAVVASFAGNDSEETMTASIGLGAITPDYHETFDTEESMAGWTILDSNGDHRTWMWSTLSNLRISNNPAEAMDDWAITPAFKLEAGTSYKLTFEVWNDLTEYAEKIEVRAGRAVDTSAMTVELVPVTEFCTLSPQTLTGVFTPSESGRYYIGFHCVSDADSWMTNLDNIAFVKGGASVGEIESAGTVRAAAGRIVVAGFGNAAVAVSTLDGRTAFTGRGDVSVALPAGIYIVSVAGKHYKLML